MRRLGLTLVSLATACTKAGDSPEPAPRPEPRPPVVATAPPQVEPPPHREPAQVPCVRPGRYELYSDGPFYVAQDGELPPTAQRKQEDPDDPMSDCKAHAQFATVVTLELPESGPEVRTDEDSSLRVEGAKLEECALSFALEGDGGWVTAADVKMDFAPDPPTVELRNVRFEILLDGEEGQHMFECGAESAVATAKTK